MGKTKSLYISAYIAFGSYFVLLFLFLIYLSTNDVKTITSMKKDTVLELEVIVEKKDSKQKVVKQKDIKNTKIAKKIVKKSTSVSAKKRTNLKSLFANVKTKAKSIKKQKVNAVKKSTNTSRFKSKFEKQRKREKIKISKITNMPKTSQKKLNTSDTNYSTDKYFSSIHTILYTKYNQLLRIDGFLATAIVTIDILGNFNYRIVKYSDDVAFNKQLVSFLDEQKKVKFPIPPQGKVSIEIDFSTRDKN